MDNKSDSKKQLDSNLLEKPVASPAAEQDSKTGTRDAQGESSTTDASRTKPQNPPSMRPSHNSADDASIANEQSSVQPAKVPAKPERLEPTRYGDWEKNGRCIDF